MINSSIDTRRPVQWDNVYSNHLPVAYVTWAARPAPAAVAVPPAHPSAARPPALWPAQPPALAAALPARAAAAAAGAASRAPPPSEWPPLRRGPCTGVWGLDFPVWVFTHEISDMRYIKCVKSIHTYRNFRINVTQLKNLQVLWDNRSLDFTINPDPTFVSITQKAKQEAFPVILRNGHFTENRIGKKETRESTFSVLAFPFSERVTI